MTRVSKCGVLDFVQACVDVPRFLSCCGCCEYYGRLWSCPPFDFSSEEIWEQYTDIMLFEEKVFVKPELRRKTYDPEKLFSTCRALLAPKKKQLTNKLLALEMIIPGSRALFAGNCELCKNCGKEQGLPCRYPNQMRYSIESLGGNVVHALKIYFDDDILWANDGHFPEYFILLGGLLIP